MLDRQNNLLVKIRFVLVFETQILKPICQCISKFTHVSLRPELAVLTASIIL